MKRGMGGEDGPEPNKRNKKAVKKQRTSKQPAATGEAERSFCDDGDDEEELPHKTIKKEPEDETMRTGKGAVGSHPQCIRDERTNDNAEIELMKGKL